VQDYKKDTKIRKRRTLHFGKFEDDEVMTGREDFYVSTFFVITDGLEKNFIAIFFTELVIMTAADMTKKSNILAGLLSF
jgi:hypothetical protein